MQQRTPKLARLTPKQLNHSGTRSRLIRQSQSGFLRLCIVAGLYVVAAVLEVSPFHEDTGQEVVGYEHVATGFALGFFGTFMVAVGQELYA